MRNLENNRKWFLSGVAMLTMVAAPNVLAWQEVAPPVPPVPAAAAEDMVRLHLAAATGMSYLGVGVVEIDKERARTLNLREEYGVEISHLEEDSPAAKAGLKQGDVVLEYNGQRVEGTQQFIRLVRETPTGRSVKLLVSRNGATQTMMATTATRKGFAPEIGILRSPNAPLPPMPPTMENFGINIPNGAQIFTMSRGAVLGVEVEPLSPQLAQFFGVKEGMLVRSVSTGSAAEKAGMKAGDVITKIDGTPITAMNDLMTKLHSGTGNRTVAVTVMRDKREMPLSVTLEEPAKSPRTRNITVQRGNGRI